MVKKYLGTVVILISLFVLSSIGFGVVFGYGGGGGGGGDDPPEDIQRCSWLDNGCYVCEGFDPVCPSPPPPPPPVCSLDPFIWEEACGGLAVLPTLKVKTSPNCGGKVSLYWGEIWEGDSASIQLFQPKDLTFDIYKNPDIYNRTPPFTSVSGITTLEVLANLTDYFTVAVRGWGPPSERTSATPSSACPFGSPALTAVTAPTCGEKINLSWTSILGATGYKVLKNNKQLIITTSTSLTTEALPDDVFSVVALSNTVDSLPSNSVSAIPSGSCSCTGLLPVGFIECPGTITDEGGKWSFIRVCPAIPNQCQYQYRDIIEPPIIPPITPPIEPPITPPIESPIDPPGNSNNPVNPVNSNNSNSNSEGGLLSVINLETNFNFGTTTEKIIQGAREILESDTGSAVAKTVTTAGVLAGGVVATSAATFSDLLLLPFKLWGLLLSIFGLKKRNRPWGTVYDSVTKQPIDPAYVTLKRLDSQEENMSITDLDGRYGFLVTPGKYILSANKTNYTFPSVKLAGRTEDSLYNNLYFGEEIIVENSNTLINKNIPLDPIKFDWNEFVKGKKKLMKFYSKRNKLIRVIGDWFFRVGFAVSLVSLFLVSAPYNYIIFGLYIVLLLLRKFGLRQKALGSLVESDGSPLSFAVVRIFDAELKVEITNKVADKIGRYFCLVPKGKYFVKVEKKNDDESYTEVMISPTIDAKNGIINQSFTV